MSDKKHIDRLFQEGLKDFEAIPSDAVWKNIESKLQKNKKRRVIPIWWRYAGVAALLLLLLTIGRNYFFNPDESQQNQVVDTETPKNSDTDNLNKDTFNNNFVVTDNENDNTEKASQKDTEVLKNKINASTEVSIAKTTASENRNNNASSSTKESNISNSVLKTKEETVIASNIIKNNSVINNDKNNHVVIDDNKAKEIIENTTIENNNAIAKTNEEVQEESNTIANNKTTKDNTLTIEEAIDKTKDFIKTEDKLNKWSIAPNAAPVYFSSLGEGSSIDPQFKNNSKTGEVNMSYGISASYAVNKKLSIRSGVNKVNLGYNTNNIVVYNSVGVNSLSSRSLQNVSTNNNSDASEGVSHISGETIILNYSPESFGSSNTSINQSLGYIEVPLEIQYALLNKKLGVNIIGGFSSFFLNNNEISSENDNGTRIRLGEATNINKISYSANFGLGLNYQVSKKIDLNLEPMFKYQINTFNNTSGDFKPYFIGVYTGFAIKF